MKSRVIVISSYPERSKTHGEKTVGVASYTKNLLKNLKNINKNINFEVLAEIHNKKEKYMEEGVVINRIWKRYSISSLIDLTSYVVKSKVMTIVVSLEFYMFGGLIQNLIFLYSLLLWKISGKKVIVLLHQVVPFLKIFYLPLIFLSDKIIVFEEVFKKVLNSRKVFFIPHGVESVNSIARKTNKKFSALYFGYISPYKGVKELKSLWEEKYGRLVIAGGPNPNHINKRNYMNYVRSVSSKGFIPENSIKTYFINSDLVILPYKMFFSSSGPLSLAFSYEKPFILSRKLDGYFDSSDFAETLQQVGLKKEDFLFDLNKESFEHRLNWVKKNLAKLAEFSKIMKHKRSWKKIARKYLQILT